MAVKIDAANSKVDLKKFRCNAPPLADPVFVDVNKETDIAEILDTSKKYRKYKKIIVIGNGGSITSFWTYYTALKHDREAVACDNPAAAFDLALNILIEDFPNFYKEAQLVKEKNKLYGIIERELKDCKEVF